MSRFWSPLPPRLSGATVAALFACLTAVATVPTDNPVATRYADDSGYPAWTDHVAWERVLNMATYGEAGQPAWQKFEAARDELHALGGGVLYYPAGTYDFTDLPADGPTGRGLMLRSGVVIRGEAPTDDLDASDGTLTLGTRFVFGFTPRTGTGLTPTGETPRDWNFVGLLPSGDEKVEHVERIGVAWVHLVGATIFWGFGMDWPETTTWANSTAWKAGLVKPAWANRIADGTHPWDYFAGSAFSRQVVGAGSGRLVLGCVLEDAAPINDLVMEGRSGGKNFGPTGYAPSKFGARIQIYASQVFVANNLLPKSTRGFLYEQTVGLNPSQTTNAGQWTNGTRTVYFNYNFVTGIDINKEYLNPFAARDVGYFLEDITVRDNWVYNHGRKGFNVSGRFVELRGNTNQRDFHGNTVPAASGPASGASHFPTLDGYVELKPGGDGSISDSLSRAFDLAGGPLWVHDNRYGGSYGSTDSMGNDGEGILCQAHGGTQAYSWAVTYNSGLDGYMAGYDVNQYGGLWAWNTTVGSTGNVKAGEMYDATVVGNVGGSTATTGSQPVFTAATGTPSAPLSPAAEAVGDKMIVTWQDGGPHEAAFRVERSIDGGAWQAIAYRPRQETGHAENPAAWHDHNAPRGRSLRYRVAALDAAGQAAAVSAEVGPVALPSLGPIATPVDPATLTLATRPGWESDYRTRVDWMLAKQRWTNTSGNGDTDSGKRDWPALLAEMYKVQDRDADLLALINGGNVNGLNGGQTLLNSSYSGSFYKAFTVPGYNFYYFLLRDGLREGISLPPAQRTKARAINWSYLTREDNRMDPIYGQTEFNSENFNWMARLGGLQWAFELPETDLGTYAYNDQAGQPKGLSRAYFRNYLNNWTRAFFHSGRVEWNSAIYWGYTANPILTLYEFPPEDPEDPTFAAKVRQQARAGMDWMLLENALHYLDGVSGGPDARAKTAPHRVFNGSAWVFNYAYFADGPFHPTYSADAAQANMDMNMSGWLPWSSYRPLRVVQDIANRRYPLPVEIISAKPFYHLDHNNYASWRGDGDYSTWRSAKEAETLAHRTGFRFEFETIWQDENVLLASLSTWRPDGSRGTFSEQNLLRVIVRGEADGALQIAGNTGRFSNPAGRDPYEQIAQWGEVVLRTTRNPSSTQNRFWYIIPVEAERVRVGDRLFVNLGQGVFAAFLPLGSPTVTEGDYSTNSTVTHRRYYWAYAANTFGALALEIGTTRTHADFEAFQASFADRQVTSPAANEAVFTSARGRELRVAWTGTHSYPMTENGGYTLSVGGKIPRVWKDGVEEDFNTWPTYGVREGAEIVRQDWGSGLLQLAAGGETVQISVDPETAAVTYASVAGAPAVAAPPGPFNAWAESRFTPQEIAAGAAEPAADPDGDGRPNLVEYAFGSLPAHGDESGDPVAVTPGTDGVITLSYPEAVTGVVRRIGWTVALDQPWQSVPLAGPGAPPSSHADGRTTVTLTLPGAPTAAFVRLELEPPPLIQ